MFTALKALPHTNPEAVLIAAAFCMFNCYVDGQRTWAPQDRRVYVDRAAQRAKDEYIGSIIN